MTMSAQSPCVIEVPSTPPRPDAPGDLPDAGGGSLEMLLLGLVLVAAGVVIARRRRGASGVAALAAVLALGTGISWIASGQAPAHAEGGEAPGCSLIEVDEIIRDGDAKASTLLPGEEAEALRYTVRNVTGFPVSLTIATDAEGSPLARKLTAVLSGDPGGERLEAPLSELPESSPLILDPGQHLEVTYRVLLDLAAGDDLQDSTALFDSIITATGPSPQEAREESR